MMLLYFRFNSYILLGIMGLCRANDELCKMYASPEKHRKNTGQLQLQQTVFMVSFLHVVMLFCGHKAVNGAYIC